MKTLTRNELLLLAADMYTTGIYPEELDLSSEEFLEVLEDRVWEPLEYFQPEDILEMIMDAAHHLNRKLELGIDLEGLPFMAGTPA